MRIRLALLPVLGLTALGCQATIPAEMLPYRLTVAWNATTANVTAYNVYLDDTKVVTTPTAIDITCPGGTCNGKISISTAGRHTVAVTAVNRFGESVINGCASCSVTFNLSVTSR